jgi:aryl-alcohol dehydrogenase-like predicted oxidoreductase
VQIIFNMFRHRPAEVFFAEAQRRRVGILARVPLASGLLSGKMTRDTKFEANDHRQFNRHGESFDVGETFSGVDYETGLRAVEELKACLPLENGWREEASLPLPLGEGRGEGESPSWTLTQFALRWILMHDAVTCAIPGGKRPQQVEENSAAADLPPLSDDAMCAVRRIYDAHVRKLVHQRW